MTFLLLLSLVLPFIPAAYIVAAVAVAMTPVYFFFTGSSIHSIVQCTRS